MPTDPPPPASQVEQDRIALSEPTRQAPLAPIVFVLQAVRQASLFNLAAIGLVASRFRDFWWVAPIVVIVLAAMAVTYWWRYTFRVEGDDLIVERGLISRERTTIPLSRVQSVSIEQGIVNRALGLVAAKIETAGSAEAELTLEAVARPTAEAIRRLSTRTATSTSHTPATAGDGAPPAPPEPGRPQTEQGERVVLHRSLRDLSKIALSSNPLAGLGGLAGALLFFGDELGDLIDFEGRAEGAVGSLRGSPSLIVGVVLLAILISAVASFLATVVPLHELTLFRSGDGLRTTSGLLSRRERVSSIERVQIASFSRNPIEKAFGMWTARLPSAGSREDDDSGAIRLPGTTNAECDLIVAELGSELSARPLANGIARDAVMRWTLWCGLVPAIGAVAVLWNLVGRWSLLALLFVLPAWLWARRNQAAWRWQITPENIEIDRGVLVDQQAIMAVRKVQAVQVERNLFHRRRGLATLNIGTAAGNVRVPHIPVDVAQAARDELCYRAETDPRRFM